MGFIDKVMRELRQIETVVASSDKISPSDLLHKVAEIVDIPFVVAGGFSRSIHATPRATGDVDVVVASKDLAALKSSFEKAEFKFKETLEYQKPTIIKYEYRGREVDIIDYSSPEFVDFIMESCIKKTVFTRAYSFMGLEALLVTKLCSFRFKDKADIVDLLKANKAVDLDTIKVWCITLGILDRFAFLSEDHKNEM